MSPLIRMRVALITLAFERRFGAMQRPRYADAAGRALDQARREADAHFETCKPGPRHEQIEGSRVRQEIARLLSMQRVSHWTAQRAQASRERALGLPREPAVDMDRPFRESLRNAGD
jgi:hypothetical protein